MAAPKPNRHVLFLAAALAIALVAGIGGFIAGRTGPSEAAAASASTVPAAAAAGGHDHGGQAAAQAPVGGPSTGVKVKRDWVTENGDKFSIWVAFGPPEGGGTMCTVGGRAGYQRGMVILVHSDPANKKPGKGPTLGTKGGRVAFSFGEYACTWNISNSSVKPFKPGETRSIIGLVEPTRDQAHQKLVLTVVRPGKPPYELAKIPYAAMFS